MTTEIEEQLRIGMSEHTTGIALGSELLQAAKRRHARRTAFIRTGVTTAVLGVAGVVTVAVTQAGAPSPTGRPPVAAASSPATSPALSLAAAAAASSNISYHMKVTTSWARFPSSIEGAFDPTTVTGYMRSADGSFEQRLIAGALYSRGAFTASEPFIYSGKHEVLPATRSAVGDTGLQSADPQQLVIALQEANATITKTSDKAYHYQLTKPPWNGITHVTEGNITLDADGRIAKVTCEITATLPGGSASRNQVTIELSGYGQPVQVEVPTNVQR